MDEPSVPRGAFPLTDLVVTLKQYDPAVTESEQKNVKVVGGDVARLVFYASQITGLAGPAAFFDLGPVARELGGLAEICRSLSDSSVAEYHETVESIFSTLGHKLRELAARVETIDVLGSSELVGATPSQMLPTITANVKAVA
jgi:hypothetical protein